MPSYVMLLTWTDQGARAAKDTIKRADTFKKQAEKFGARMRETLWTMGPYDAIGLFEAPDDATVSRLAIWAGSQGNVKTLTMRCYTASEMSKIVEGL